MSALEASSAGIRDMADGTLRLTIDFEPRFAKQAFELFGARGTPIAIAALKPIHQRGEIVPPAVDPIPPPLGPMCMWLVSRCKEPAFRSWLIQHYAPDTPDTEKDARDLVCELLEVESRKEVDGNRMAEERCKGLLMQPYSKRAVLA